MKQILLLLIVLLPVHASAFPAEDEIALLQKTIAPWSTGERIAFWAEQFLGLPYDPDPEGEYVSRNVIVTDERVDCMYLAFRSVELALGKDPAESEALALKLRFHDRGVVDNGKVVNYENRFKYGEDMIESGKWGQEITSELGETVTVKGSRGRERVIMIRKQDIRNMPGRLKNGDLIFFIKTPSKRVSEEIVGHMGIIKLEGDDIYLINASGQKNRGGRVKKTLFSEYSKDMPFAGIRVGRLQ
jgi:hypothetical protein